MVFIPCARRSRPASSTAPLLGRRQCLCVCVCRGGGQCRVSQCVCLACRRPIDFGHYCSTRRRLTLSKGRPCCRAYSWDFSTMTWRKTAPSGKTKNFVNHLCVRGQIRCVKGYNDVSQHRSFSPGSGLFEVETIPSKRKDAPLEKVRDGAAQRPQVLFLPVPEEGALRHKGDPPNRQVDEPVVMIS